MLERFGPAKCCCDACANCTGSNPDEYTLTLPAGWSAAPYGTCTGTTCDGYAGDYVLAGYSPCTYFDYWRADTPGCIPNLGGFTTILWAISFVWKKTGSDYIAEATLSTWQSFGGFGGATLTLATWSANFGPSRPSCTPAGLELPLIYSHPNFCTPPATPATLTA